MRRILALAIVVMSAIMVPVASYSIKPELKALEDALNEQCPFSSGDGITMTKVKFIDDHNLEFYYNVLDLVEVSKNDVTPELRKLFRDSFLAEFTQDNEFVPICKAYGLNQIYILCNPKGEEVFREIFKPSDY